MNRRSFFAKLGLAAASFAILPAATTYARQWKPASAASSILVPNPEWETATYVIEFQWDRRAFEMIGGDALAVQKANQFFETRCNFKSGQFVRVEPFLKVPVDSFGFPN